MSFPVKMAMRRNVRCSVPLLKTVEAGDLWIEDRNFCTRAFLCDIDNRGAFFITREHRGLKFEIVEALRECGRTETGSVAQQRVTSGG